MKTPVILAALATASFATTFTVQAAFSPETLLPENTLALVAVRDIQKDCAEFKTSPFGLLLNDPAMKPFCDYVKEEVTLSLSDLTKTLEEKKINLSDYKDLFKGGAAFALTSVDARFDSDEEPVGVEGLALIMAELNEGPEKLKASLDDLQSKLDITFEVNKIGDIEFRVIPLGAESDGALWVGAQGSLFYGAFVQNDSQDIAYATEALGQVLKKEEGKKVLANTSVFKGATHIKPDRNYLWVNFSLVTDAIKEYVLLLDKKYVAPEDMMQAMMAPPRPLAIYNALGLDAIKSLSFSSWNENGESYCTTQVICPANERRGISALFDTWETTDCGPTEMIPANVMSYSKTQINVKKFWDILDTTSTEAIGGAKIMMLAAMDEKLATAKVDLRKAFLENLTGEIITLSYPFQLDVKDLSQPDETSFEINGMVGNVYLLGVKDPELFLSTVKSLADLVNPGKSEEMMQFFSKTGSYISIHSPVMEMMPLVKAFVEGDGKAQEKSLAKCPNLQEAVKKIGGFEGIQFSYCNMKEFYPIIGEVSKKLLAVEKANKDIPDQNNPTLEKIYTAFEKLPPVSAIEKYLGIMISTSKLTSEGLESTSYAPWPKGLER